MIALQSVLDALQAIAPLHLAGGWDNVGLLVEGPPRVRRLFACIDLTEAVLDEALASRAELVLAYHPPVFSGLKRLAGETPTERIVARLLRAGVGVYSPHTALDAARGGMADWLLDGVGETTQRAPIAPDVQDPRVGAGRLGHLHLAVALDVLIPRLKAHLGLPYLRVAGPGVDVRSVAVCPGAGGSLFEQVDHADLFVTGEMRHHDVLARVAQGATVVLTDHTNTERGYLQVLAGRVHEATGLEVVISSVDADPLRVV